MIVPDSIAPDELSDPHSCPHCGTRFYRSMDPGARLLDGKRMAVFEHPQRADQGWSPWHSLLSDRRGSLPILAVSCESISTMSSSSVILEMRRSSTVQKQPEIVSAERIPIVPPFSEMPVPAEVPGSSPTTIARQ